MDCKSLLDVGGGIGMLNEFLPLHVRHHVVDRSPKGKSIGEDVYQTVRFTTGTIEELSGKYDAVVALSLIEHLNGYVEFLGAVWGKTNKVTLISFRNGLDDVETIRPKGKDYWDNKYSWPKMEGWIQEELSPKEMWIERVKVDRPYSPELVLVLVKE